jgi:hypothetical protein
MIAAKLLKFRRQRRDKTRFKAVKAACCAVPRNLLVKARFTARKLCRIFAKKAFAAGVTGCKSLYLLRRSAQICFLFA